MNDQWGREEEEDSRLFFEGDFRRGIWHGHGGRRAMKSTDQQLQFDDTNRRKDMKD